MSSNKTKKKNGTASASRMKQGNLFSFFKKLSPKDKTKNKSISATTANSSSQATTTPSSGTDSESSLVRRPTSENSVSNNAKKWEKIKINMRLAVLWPDDNQYYPGTVKQEKDGKHKVVYDDGDHEWIDLRHEKFRFIEEGMELEDDEEEERAPARQIQQAKKRPRIYDSDDEEFEMDDAPQDDDEDEDDMEYEDEKEEDHWLVNSDEEEDSPQKPVKKGGSSRANKRTKITEHKIETSCEKLTKVTPKGSKTSSSPTLSGTTLATPTSLESFSAFSVSKSTKPPRRVTPSFSTRKSFNAAADATETGDGETALPYTRDEINGAGSHVHNHLKFLSKPYLKDAQGRSPGQPGYSPRTLRVDYAELKTHYNAKGKENKDLSPGVKQWWETKAQYWDTILFFKTGKFYEIFHNDCDVAVRVCGLQYMRGHVAHCGFPESAYGPMADRLVRAGYKVARCEQTETPEQLKERQKKTKGSAKPKVVNREVCSILTMGTRTYCYLDGELASNFCPEASGSGPLLVIKEVEMGDENQQDRQDDLVPSSEYGIVVVNAARGAVTIGQFADDVLRSRMITLLTTYNPSEVLLEGEGGASATLRALLKSVQATSSFKFRIEDIGPTETFPKSCAIDASIRAKLNRCGIVKPWDVQQTLEELHRREYFPRASKQQQTTSTSRWPSVLHSAVEGGADLALSALGGALFYLQRNLIDEEILSMGLCDAYCPPASPIAESESLLAKLSLNSESSDLTAMSTVTPTATPTPTIEARKRLDEEENISHMALDGNTLVQLEILTNSIDNNRKGSLSWFIDYTKSPHGARMLRAWLLRPLFRKAEIDRRADAVEELLSGEICQAMNEAAGLLSKCGDIERLVSTIHAQSGAKSSDEERGSPSNTHPSARAILYEAKLHTKRKVGNFSKVLNGLRSASRIPEVFSGIAIQSGLLQKIVRSTKEGGGFPDITEHLDWFEENVDLEKAAEGEFEPARGVDPVYDDACDEVDRIQVELEAYKEEICSTVLRGNARALWKFVNTSRTSKDKYLIELPKSIKVPSEFIMKGKRGSGAKQINKYRTRAVDDLVKHLEDAFEACEKQKATALQHIFQRFDSKRHLWKGIVLATAVLDALASLAELGKKPGYCRPEILECPFNSSPCINIVQGRHPCIEKTFTGDFIPNDLSLGSQEQGEGSPMVLLLSGPNMGGKSTLLRQTCLICILAQIGAMVPADSCSLTPIDQIHTRLGASDRILMGQSTFFVELAETAAALRGASRRSLILFDELGRGTSSFDGTAIASACLSYICSNLKCMSLFATHYHSLLDERKDDPLVRLAHMESTVEEDSSSEDNITFLYTLGDGACPKSFGINVARLAQLPEEVLEKAARISSDFEMEMNGGRCSRLRPEEAMKQKQELIEMINTGDDSSCEKMWGLLQTE